MGHLVNSNLFRLGVSKSWNYKVLQSNNYFNEFFLVKFLMSFLESFFYNSTFLDRGIFFSHFFFNKCIKRGHNLSVCLFSGYFNRIIIKFFQRNRFKFNKIKKFGARQLFMFKYIRFSQNFLFFAVKRRFVFDLYKVGIMDVNFLFLFDYSISASVLGRLIAFKLKNFYTLGEVVNPIVKNFMLIRRSGLAINCSGRFTRKQRAHFLKFRFGSVPYGKVVRKVEYFFISITLKYGACGLKIWLSPII